MRLPLMISVTITDRSGRTLSGQTLDAFYSSIAHAQAVQRRHQLRARRARDAAVPRRARAASPTCYVSCYPNAGLPNAFGEYDELPDETGGAARASSPTAASSTSSAAAAARRRITSAAIARAVDGARRRAASGSRRRDAGFQPAARSCSGLEPLDDPARQQLPDDRRAHQRHRLEEVRAADQGRRLRRGASRSRSSRCAAAPTSSTSTWTKACSTPSRR